MAIIRLWTVARFPNGSWSFGGKVDDPAYSESEVFRIPAFNGKEAIKKAQGQRRRDLKKKEKAQTMEATCSKP